ncbi:MAG: hypothetical protein ACLFUF_05720 [Opitutales bacterium]
MEFHQMRRGMTFDVTGYTVLSVDAPQLSADDAGRPLLLLDSTWRLLPELEACLAGEGIKRSLPPVKSAYPRVSKLSADPPHGLASVEALYLACLVLGHREDWLLRHYHWRSSFMRNLESAGLPASGIDAARDKPGGG